MNNTLEIISVISSVIGVVFPIVKFIIEKIQGKNNENKTQQNTSMITGNNNSVHQQNTEKKTVIINKYYNNCPNKNTTASNTKITAYEMIILGVFISLVLCYVFIKLNTIIISAYLIAFGILMFVLCFSPLTRKHKIIFYIINIILLCLVLGFTYKEFWDSDVITLYNQLFEDSNLGVIISYVFNHKSLIAFQVVLIMIMQLVVSISTVIQCVYHIFYIVLCKIKGFNEKISSKMFRSLININAVPISAVLFLVIIIIISLFQK